jgi:hypothetical protein
VIWQPVVVVLLLLASGVSVVWVLDLLWHWEEK